MATDGGGAEASALLGRLDYQRDHVLGIVSGLSDADLRRPVLPSGWSCLAMVNHLTYDVEWWWFTAIVGSEGADIDALGSDFDAWHVAADTPADEVIGRYRAEVERSNAVLQTHALDASLAYWPVHVWPDFRYDSFRDVVLHVLVETATHAGHLDAARELIDGRQWLVV